MRLNSVLGVSALAATGYAQMMPAMMGISYMGLTISPPCEQALVQVLTNSSFAQCFDTADLLPLVTSNMSIVPVLDHFMTDLCYNTMPCSNASLQNASEIVLAGCSADLANASLPNATVTTAFSLYPLVREMLCLKTTDPYTNTSYGGVLGSPPIPVTSPAYNMTNGTFCVTSLLTQLSAYFGTNLTVPYIEAVATGMNMSALELIKTIQPNILCNGCIFGALDLLEEAYPAVGTVPIAAIYAALKQNTTIPPNVTINSLVDGECVYAGLNATSNGTLPMNITVSIINSTFPLPMANST